MNICIKCSRESVEQIKIANASPTSARSFHMRDEHYDIDSISDLLTDLSHAHTHTHVTNSRDTKMQWMEKIQFTKQRNPETTIRNTKYYSIPRNLISIEFLRSKPNFLRNIVEIMAKMALKWTKQTTNQVCHINAK